MTICFVFWGHYAGAVDAIRCAVARGGCPVVVVSERPHGVKGAEWISIHTFGEANDLYAKIREQIGQYKWMAPTVARWIVLQQLVERRHDLTWPIWCSDWDVLLFSDLKTAYAPFMQYDLTISSYWEGNKLERSAAYALNHTAPLDRYCTMIRVMLAGHDPLMDGFHDMKAWQAVIDNYGFKAGNLFETIAGSVFDHNIAVLDKRFEPGPDGYKDVRFCEGQPYFVGVDGVPVRAHSIHAWNKWKTKTGELRAHAGIL